LSISFLSFVRKIIYQLSYLSYLYGMNATKISIKMTTK